MPEAREQVPLPPGLDLLWGRRERGKRGPRAGLSADAIVAAAIRIADAKGLEAVSMARVAHELGFTTMSLYRHVASKEELLQLMWNASALGAEDLVIEGDDWRVPAADVGDHPAGHARPPSVDHPDADGRSAGRAELAALRRARSRDARRDRPRGRRQAADHRPAQFLHAQRGPDGQRRRPRAAAAQAAASDGPSGPPVPFESLLRELLDEQTYPRLYRIAWTPAAATVSERDEFLFGIDRILDGVAALIERTREGGSG